jgi:hypothetical protein
MKRKILTVMCLVLPALAGAAVSRDANGWTVVTPSADSRVIYVSSSEGNDANDGLSPSAPKRTVGAAKALLRTTVVISTAGKVITGFPDHMLFKRGDVWSEGLGGWSKCGRSPQEPVLVGAYGTGARPRFDISGFGGSGWSAILGDDIPSKDNVVLMGLHFRGVNPQNGVGLFSSNGGLKDFLLEDMVFERGSVGIQYDAYVPQRITFRRCLFLDNFSNGGAHAQGLYLYKVAETVVEENVFDRCGWNPDLPQANPTIFNHCIYWQSEGAPDGVVRDNIILRGSSHGVQMRSSGHVLGNVFVRNAISGFVANGYDHTITSPQESSVIGNVISEGEDITPREGHPTNPSGGTDHRGWGWEVLGGTTKPWRVIMRDNIVTTNLGHMPRSISLGTAEVDFVNNIVWNWPAGGAGLIPPDPGPFMDPDRTVASYNASIGGVGTFEAFAAEVRKQSKDNWRQEYTAPAIIAYFREGFTRPSGGDDVPPARPRGLRVR